MSTKYSMFLFEDHELVIHVYQDACEPGPLCCCVEINEDQETDLTKPAAELLTKILQAGCDTLGLRARYEQ